MTTLGMHVAKPPKSPFANLAAVERTGSDKGGTAVWRMACTCGRTLTARAPVIKSGGAHCRDCNPTYGEQLENRILAVLPATIDEIIVKTGMTRQQVKFRLRQMKPALCHTGRWRRSTGTFLPVIVAGPGEDVPCALERRTVADLNRRYRLRIKKAVARAMAGGKEDVRYVRHIGVAKVNETTERTRVAPQTWFSALTQ